MCAYPLNISVSDDDVKKNDAITYSREDYSVVNRFESHGGGWGYSGHSVEAIRFMADVDVLLGGFGLFGGRGEYLGKIKGTFPTISCNYVMIRVHPSKPAYTKLYIGREFAVISSQYRSQRSAAFCST